MAATIFAFTTNPDAQDPHTQLVTAHFHENLHTPLP